jgi:hypothetical protein
MKLLDEGCYAIRSYSEDESWFTTLYLYADSPEHAIERARSENHGLKDGTRFERFTGDSSFKVQFLVDGKWYDNDIRLVTRDEAACYGRDKFMAWTVPSSWRVTASCDKANYRYSFGKLKEVEG